MTTKIKGLVPSDLVKYMVDPRFCLRTLPVVLDLEAELVLDNADLLGSIVELDAAGLAATQGTLLEAANLTATSVVGIVMGSLHLDGTYAMDATLGTVPILVTGPALYVPSKIPNSLADEDPHNPANLKAALALALIGDMQEPTKTESA